MSRNLAESILKFGKACTKKEYKLERAKIGKYYFEVIETMTSSVACKFDI